MDYDDCGQPCIPPRGRPQASSFPTGGSSSSRTPHRPTPGSGAGRDIMGGSRSGPYNNHPLGSGNGRFPPEDRPVTQETLDRAREEIFRGGHGPPPAHRGGPGGGHKHKGPCQDPWHLTHGGSNTPRGGPISGMPPRGPMGGDPRNGGRGDPMGGMPIMHGDPRGGRGGGRGSPMAGMPPMGPMGLRGGHGHGGNPHGDDDYYDCGLPKSEVRAMHQQMIDKYGPPDETWVSKYDFMPGGRFHKGGGGMGGGHGGGMGRGYHEGYGGYGDYGRY